MSFRPNSASSGDRLDGDRRGELGQDLVEMALLLPLLLALTFGIIDFGRAFFTYNTLANAAREGARYGTIEPADTSGIQSAAMRLTAGLPCVPRPVPTVLPAAPADRTSTVTVKIDCTFPLITGVIPQALGGSNTIPLKTQATMRVE